MVLNEHEVTKVLIPFDVLCDIDSGLMMLVNFEYHNEKYFRFPLFTLTEEEYAYVMTRRREKNPLYLISNGKLTEETLNNLYVEFMEKEYEQILKLSRFTSIADVIELRDSLSDGTLTYTVICNREEEIELLKEREISFDYILKNDSFSIAEYTDIYVNDIYNILDYDIDELYGKNIHIANCSYNKEEIDGILVFCMDVIEEIYDSCNIKAYELYAFEDMEDE